MFRISDREFQLLETLHEDDIAPLFSGEWTGSRVWESSLEIGELVHSEVQRIAKEKEGRAPFVVELGSGCGLISLVACAAGARVTATDIGAMVPLIEKNAASNLSTEELGRFRCQVLQWGSLEDIANVRSESQIDLLIGCDLLNPVYGEDSFRQLAETLVALAPNKDAQILLAYECRCRTAGGEEDAVWSEFSNQLRRLWPTVQFASLVSSGNVTVYEITR